MTQSFFLLFSVKSDDEMNILEIRAADCWLHDEVKSRVAPSRRHRVIKFLMNFPVDDSLKLFMKWNVTFLNVGLFGHTDDGGCKSSSEAFFFFFYGEAWRLTHQHGRRRDWQTFPDVPPLPPPCRPFADCCTLTSLNVCLNHSCSYHFYI